MSTDTRVEPAPRSPSGLSYPLRLAGALVAALAASAAIDTFTANSALDAFQAVVVGPVASARGGAPRLGESRVILVDATASGPDGRLDRAELAAVVDAARARGAWAVGVDDPLDGRRAGDDALTRACAASGKVVSNGRFGHDGTLAPAAIAGTTMAATPLVADRDGRLRRVQHRFEKPDSAPVHSMVIELLRLLAGPRRAEVAVGGRALVVEFEAAADVVVPFDAGGESLLQFQGPPGTVPSLTAAEFVAGRPEVAHLAGRAVIAGRLGGGATGWVVPFAERAQLAMSGPEVIAQDLMGRLAGERRATVPRRDVWALRLGAAIAGAMLARVTHTVLANAVAGALALGLLALSFFAFGLSDLQAFYPPLGLAVSLLVGLRLARGPRAATLPTVVVGPSAPRLPGFAGRVMDTLTANFSDVVFLGAGGMASVYAATDRATGQRVAVKVPSEELLDDATARQRFMREIQALMEVDHPNVIRLLGVSVGAVSYYSMELIEGDTLSRAMVEEVPLSRASALELVRPIASALAAMHARGLIHRDLKPANILVRKDGRLVLSDFGLAFDAARQRMTRTGAVLGTPAYMAPEQIEADMPTPAVDVYAFGTVLYELLTGERPFTGDPLVTKLAGPAPLLRSVRPELDLALEEFVARCLARDPAARPPDGEALIRHLRDLVSGEDTSATHA